MDSCCQQRMYKNHATWMRNKHGQCDELEERSIVVGDAWPNNQPRGSVYSTRDRTNLFM